MGDVLRTVFDPAGAITGGKVTTFSLGRMLWGPDSFHDKNEKRAKEREVDEKAKQATSEISSDQNQAQKQRLLETAGENKGQQLQEGTFRTAKGRKIFGA